MDPSELVIKVQEDEDLFGAEDAPGETDPEPTGEATTETSPAPPGDNADTDSVQPKDDNQMEVEEAKAVNTGWVDIIEKENNLKLLSELNKIGKLIRLHTKAKDMTDHVNKHKISVFPIYPEDLADPYIITLMQKCTTTQVTFHTVKEGDHVQTKGLLELRFAKLDDMNDNREQLSQMREDIKVSQSDRDETFMKEWRVCANIPDRKCADQLMLFAPSLPENVTESEMWELFPQAKEVVLVPGAPRQHAYIKFTEESVLQTAIEDLKARGPPRADFNFCRLVRFSKIASILKEENQKKQKPSGTITSPARPSTSVEGRRRPRNKRSRKRPNQSERSKTEAEQKQSEPKAAPQTEAKSPTKTQPKAPAKKASQSTAAKARANNQRSQAAGSRPRPNIQSASKAGANRNKNWYNERRALHLDRVRNAGRMANQPRMDKTSEGLQVLDNLLTSLGRLSAGPNPVNMQPPMNKTIRRKGRQREKRGDTSQRGGRMAQGVESSPQNGHQSQGGRPRQQRGGQRQQRAVPQSPSAQTGYGYDMPQRPRGPPRDRRADQDRGPESYMPRNVPGYDRSPVKRQHSMEDLSRSADSQYRNNSKRRRRNRRSSMGQDFGRPTSSQAYYSEYEAAPRRPPPSSYDSPMYNHSGYEGGYGRNTGSQDGYSMLDALSRLTREADQNRNRQQGYGRFNMNNEMSSSMSSLYDRPSYY